MDKDMYNQSRLLNRNNTYYYRAKIPADLQSHFGKKERKFSLRTKDRAKAAALVRKFSVEEDEEFSRLRALKNKEFQTVTTIDNAFIQEICKRYHHAVLHGDENLRKDKETRDILEVHMGNRTGLMSDLRTALAYGDADKIKPALSVFLLLNKIILDCSEADYEDLSYEFLKALTQTHEKQLDRDNGKVIGNPPKPLSTSIYPENSITWDVLIDKWINKVIDRPETTVDAVSNTFSDFQQFIAKDPEQITKTDVEAFRDHLFEIIGNKYGTVLKKIRFISTVFQVSVEAGLLKNNPAAGVKIEKPRRTDNRMPYDFNDLERIFSSPIYNQGQRPKGGAGEAAFWLPMLGLFSGARLEEIAQLRTSDIKQERNIWYIDIAESSVDENKKGLQTHIKNEASIRKIPIHSQLIKFGFLDYFQKVLSKNNSRLFPDLLPDKKGKISGNFSKWWGRYARKVIGITDKKKVFHSLRHSFRDSCRDAELAEEICDRLMGHTSGRNQSIGRNYGSGFSLAKLQVAIEKIDSPGFLDKLVNHYFNNRN